MHSIPSKFLQTAHSIHNRPFTAWTCLGIEFICIADHLFLKSFWHKILMRQRQLLLFDIPLCEARSRMTFTDKCMTRPPFLSQNFTTNDTMADIGFSAKALDTRCIATEDTNVMEHRCLFKELCIKTQFRVRLSNLQTSVCNLTGMNH